MYRLMGLLLLLLALTACGTAPSQETSDDARYYTTQGRPPMSWELRVWDPDRPSTDTPRVAYTNAAPGGIVQGFRWSVRGDGAPLQMRFSAVPAGVDIGPRDIVQLIVDGTPAFWGPVTRSWPSDEQDVREYIALGGVELLRRRIHQESATYEGEHASDYAQWMVMDYGSPVLVDAANFVATGSTLTLDDPYGLELGRVLDALAGYVSADSVTWGVDASGYAYFRPTTDSIEVGYREADLHWQPEQSEDVLTGVYLLLANRDDPEPSYKQGEPGYPVYIGATLGTTPPVERTYSASGLIITELPQASEVGAYGMDDVANAYDGDPATYAKNNTNGAYIRITRDTINAIGVALAYRLTAPASGYIHVNYYVGSAKFRAVRYKLEAADDVNVIRAIALPPLVLPYVPSGGTYRIEVTVKGTNITIPDQFRIYEMELITIDRTRGEAYARSLLNPPTQRPATIHWDRYQAPKPRVTVTGAPGGDLTHEVKEWAYSWTPHRLDTIAKLGSRADDDLTTAINRVAQLNQAGALATARALTETK